MHYTYNAMFLNKREVRQHLSDLCRESGLTIRTPRKGPTAGITFITYKGSLVIAGTNERHILETWSAERVAGVIARVGMAGEY